MSRTEEIKTERRRRKGDINGVRKRLAVDESKLDREKYDYRFANDEGDRIRQLTKLDDWDIVSNDGVKEDSKSMGGKVSAHAGVSEQGAPVRAILLRKPKTYADEDRAAKARKIDAVEEGIKHGNVPGGDPQGAYTPSTGVKISTG